MTRPSALRVPWGPKALVFSLVLAAIALAMAPTGPPGLELFDSFESIPGPWALATPDVTNTIDFMPPSGEPLPARRAAGAWDGSKALRVHYDGSSASPRAEAIGSFLPTGNVYLRLMVYVPSATALSMAAGDEVRIARVMPTSTDSGASLSLSLARSATGMYLAGGMNQRIGDPIATDILPDTWHVVELTYTEDTVNSTCDVNLYVDDLSAPRASAPTRNVCIPSSTAVAVGLAGLARVTTGQPLVYWLDDVKAGALRAGLSSPLFHYQQDGYDGPSIAVGDDPAGKALVAVGNGSDSVTWSASGHRGGGMVADDSSAAVSYSAAYGELPVYDAGIGKLYHRVWWRQGPVTTAGSHPLVGIASDALLGTTPPLGNPMAALSVGSDGGTLILWGYSLVDGGAQADTPQPVQRALGAGWHLLELEVSTSGSNGLRAAWVDGTQVASSTATWTGVRPSRWIDGHLPDPTNSAYQGLDEYDDSRTSLFQQPNHFKVFIPGALDAGTCAALSIQANDSSNGSAAPAEDVWLSYDSHGSGAFYSDSSCMQSLLPAASLLVPSGQPAVQAWFRAAGSGSARITLSAPDYLSNDTFFSINGTLGPDSEPPTTPGRPVFSDNPVDEDVVVWVSWKGSNDDGGSGLAKYQVEASLYDGGWMPDYEVMNPVPGMDAGYAFDPPEGYWKLRVRAVDGDNNASLYSPESVVFVKDVADPDPPPDPPVATLGIDGGYADVSWGPGADNGGQVQSGIRLYAVHFEPIPPIVPQLVDCQEYTTSCTFPVLPGHQYTMWVQSMDNAGNVGGYGPPGTFTYPGPAASLRLRGADLDANYAVVDDPYPVTVEALDISGNVATDYTGTVVFEAKTPSGNPFLATLPLDGGTYQFKLADQGRQSFSPGFFFRDSGTALAKVKDVNTNFVGQLQVTVLDRNDIRIVHDANPSAAIDVPYLYNAAGRVRVISSDPPITFSLCSGSVPNGFVLDSSTGAIAWTPESGTNFPVDLCVRATAGHGATDTYSFIVNKLTSGNNPPFAYFTAMPNQADAGAQVVFDSTPSSWDVALGPPAYRWRFGDGSPLSFRSDPFRAYQLPGGYRPSLSLFDGIGRSDQTSRQVRIADQARRLPPGLAILTKPQSARDSLAVMLVAQPSAGAFAPGPVRWDLGNGAYAEGPDAGANYLPGRYWATAATVDQVGLAATDKVEIAVARGDRVPPLCVATVSPTVATTTNGQARVDFVGWRAPGTKKIATVTWTIDGAPTAAGEVTMMYPSTGWHHATLTVTDEEGLTCTDSVSALVLDARTTTPSVPPRILDPGVTGPIDCKQNYAGRPALASGPGPLTWSVVDTKPEGVSLSFDAATGKVTWKPTVLPDTPAVTYGLVVDGGAMGSDRVDVSIPYLCEGQANLGTSCGGCGAGGGGPAAAGLVLLSLWAAARRRSAARVLVRSRRS